MNWDSFGRVVVVSVAASLVVRVLVGEETGAVGRVWNRLTSGVEGEGPA